MEIFHQSDLFVFASVTETQGLVLLEAMASGIPAVVVDALGIGDVMIDGKGGFSVPENPEAFSRTVVEVLENPELFEKKKKEAGTKADEYSLSRCTGQLEEFYRSTLANHKPRSSAHFINSVLRRRPYRNRKEVLPNLEEALQNIFDDPSEWQNRYFIMRHGGAKPTGRESSSVITETVWTTTD